MSCPLMKRFGSAAAVLSAIALVCASAGCDRSTTPGASIGFGPAPVLVGNVFITTEQMAFGTATACATVGSLTTGVTLVVASTSASFMVNQVTLHLLDGSNVGGPGVTFAPPALNAAFSNPVVAAGSSRTFVLKPTFSCGRSTPRSIRGEVSIVDGNGRRSLMSALVALP
jgi:hypothetical protein